VRPHPHIGLATVTYLFEGEVFHRDSLGSSVPIRPGEVNLMTAGRGIVHSERETSQARQTTRRLFGIQAWAALPRSHEEAAPAFVHHGTDELPRITGEGKRVRLVMGQAYGARSPVEFAHESLFAEAVLAPGAVLPLDPDHDERAVYVASGEIDVAGDTFGEGRLLVFKPGDRISILATTQARLVLLGGDPMDGPRHIWWNFVSSSKERIRQAQEDWRARRFALVPGDEKEFIPLPE
jgi:redox-sensitive bicupin YhaK (pirin superfamily)